MSRRAGGNIPQIINATQSAPQITFGFTAITELDFGRACITSDASDFTVNWGDGNSTVLSSGATPSHTYEEEGNYTVTVTPTGAARFSSLAVDVVPELTATTWTPAALATSGTRDYRMEGHSLSGAAQTAWLHVMAQLTGPDSNVTAVINSDDAALPTVGCSADVNTLNDAGVILTVSADQVSAAAVGAGGADYEDDDQLTLVGGTGYGDANGATLIATTTVVGAVTVLSVDTAGKYLSRPASPAATAADTGIGTDCTTNPTWTRTTYAPND